MADLGGTMSLNLHLPAQDLVVRVHPRFVTAERLLALRRLRSGLADRGLVVGEPQLVDVAEIVDLGGRLAEAERYVEHTKPPATWESYLWMYRAMGALHAAIEAGVPHEVPEPAVATYGTPEDLDVYVARTADTVKADPEAAEIAAWVCRLIDLLRGQWIDPGLLPGQLIHGDIRLGNVAETPAGEAAYFDFGFAAHRPRVHDLAYSLSWIVLRPDGRGRAESFDWGLVQELVSAYEDASASRLTPIEWSAVGPYVAAVPLYLAAIAGETPDPAAHLRGEVPFLRIAEWLLVNKPPLGGSRSR